MKNGVHYLHRLSRFSILINLLYIYYESRALHHSAPSSPRIRFATGNVHRVAVSVQPQGDDRRRRRGDDGRDGRVVVPVVAAVAVAADADRLPAPEDARAAKQDGVRDLVLGGPARRRSCLADDRTVLLPHLDRPRAQLEDHPASPRTKVLGRGRETRSVSPDRLTLGLDERDAMVRATCCCPITLSYIKKEKKNTLLSSKVWSSGIGLSTKCDCTYRHFEVDFLISKLFSAFVLIF